MLSQLLAIAKNTFLESIRQPIMVVLIIAATVALTLSIAGAANTLEDDNVMFIQLGLSTLLLAGLFMAGFTATGVLSLEIERKTVLTVVSKPVTRPIFILGKYLGVATAITITMWPLAMIMLLCVRHGVMQTAAHDVDGPVLAFGVTLWFAALFASIGFNIAMKFGAPDVPFIIRVWIVFLGCVGMGFFFSRLTPKPAPERPVQLGDIAFATGGLFNIMAILVAVFLAGLYVFLW